MNITQPNPKHHVTIITVIKDADQHFNVTKNSIESQNCDDFEWIVKSASTLPETIVQSIHDAAKNVQILQGPDSGIYDAMNQALAMAGGKYVFFLNSGDEFFSEHVVNNFIRHSINTPRDLIYGSFEIEGEMTYYPGELTNFFFLRTAICHQAYFLRTELIRRANGFDTTFEVLADHEIALRLKTYILSSHSRVDFPITRLPAMGFSARRRKQKEAERRQLEQRYYPWRKAWALRLILILSLRPLRMVLRKFSGYAYIRAIVLRHAYVHR